MSIKHVMQIDYEGRSPQVTSPRHEKNTYKQVFVGGSSKKIETVLVTDFSSPFSYDDFSLSSIIESGNVDLLNPVGQIYDSNLSANDNILNAFNSIENINISE